jgi:hypothetical protein
MHIGSTLRTVSEQPALVHSDTGDSRHEQKHHGAREEVPLKI